MLLPIIVYTGLFAVAEPAEPGFFVWWLTGLFILSVPLLVWFILAIVGFTFGRRAVDDLP